MTKLAAVVLHFLHNWRHKGFQTLKSYIDDILHYFRDTSACLCKFQLSLKTHSSVQILANNYLLKIY